jgi:hypothetical protein
MKCTPFWTVCPQSANLVASVLVRGQLQTAAIHKRAAQTQKQVREG